MRSTLAWLSLFALVGCCSGPPKSAEGPKLVRELSHETVALIMHEDGHVWPFCSGVWVSDHTILTAAHCAEAAVVEEKDAITAQIEYIVQGEVTGRKTEPSMVHMASVLRLDTTHDLALLSAPGASQHLIVHLAEQAPEPGESLHMIGHAAGFYWTYAHGAMSGTWEEINSPGREGPWYQVTAPLAKGMSGSGAFTDDGNLVGILSSLSPTVPEMSFYVPLATVRRFLTQT